MKTIAPPLTRRSFIRGAGVSLALPMLDAMLPRRAFAAGATVPERMVFICTSLGIHPPDFFPTDAGLNYTPSLYLDLVKEHRADFTVFSGVSHPDQAGADGHTNERTWLTSAKHPGLGGFRNTISVDQLAVEKIGFETRHPFLTLGTNSSSQSYTRSGVMIPAESKPSKVFEKLFLEGTPEQVKTQMRKIQEGRSIMDTVKDEANRFAKRVGTADREKLDEYFTSVREMEVRLAKAQDWATKPKPKVDAQPPKDIENQSDLIGRMRLLFQLVPLALQTDSTRIITILVQGRGDVPLVPGVTIDHHNLSHHGQDPVKIEQLRLIEEAEMKAMGDLLTSLKAKSENGAPLLDHTMVLYGSNLGNANSHDTHNLPLLFAGGGFKHQGHVKFDEKNNTPFSNLFVTMLQKMKLEMDSFGSSTGTISLG